MSDPAFGKALRDIGFADRLFPSSTERQLDALKRTVDNTGALAPEAIAPYRSPQVMAWAPLTTHYQRVTKAGVLTLISVYASTAPTSGNALISLFAISELEPTTLSVVASVNVFQNQKFGTASPMIPVQTGLWLIPSLTTSASGSGFNVSINITQD